MSLRSHPIVVSAIAPYPRADTNINKYVFITAPIFAHVHLYPQRRRFWYTATRESVHAPHKRQSTRRHTAICMPPTTVYNSTRVHVPIHCLELYPHTRMQNGPPRINLYPQTHSDNIHSSPKQPVCPNTSLEHAPALLTMSDRTHTTYPQMHSDHIHSSLKRLACTNTSLEHATNPQR